MPVGPEIALDYVLAARLSEDALVQFPLPAQGTITIGREPPADIILADRFLSRLHLEIRCNDGIFELVDEDSRNGTLVNGVRARRTAIRHGDALQAGQTLLRLSAVNEAGMGAPLLAAPPQGLSPEHTALADVIKTLSNFAVVDSATDPGVLLLLQHAGARFQSLYEGEPAVALAPFGPFLVDLQPVAELLPLLIQRGWGKSWGVFLKTAISFEDLRRHLRKFLTVQSADESRMLFRFYDPRVLRTFLASAEVAVRTEFFGDVKSFVVETGERDEALIFAKAASAWQALPPAP